MGSSIDSRYTLCAYCGTHAKPNSMYCLSCGQIITAITESPKNTSKVASQRTCIELQLANGSRVAVNRSAVLGRKPETAARHLRAQAIIVTDDSTSVSRVHAIIRVHGVEAVFIDAHSANGSVVERSGKMFPIAGDQQLSLRDGDRLWLGAAPLNVAITPSA